MRNFQNPHKNKTFATLLALTLGTIGAHRFYLYGRRDILAWMHALSLILTYLLTVTSITQAFFKATPILISTLAGFMAALINGLTSDKEWDQTHNSISGTRSNSRWPLALILVLTMLIGSTALIATISRLFDLLFTGGAYG